MKKEHKKTRQPIVTILGHVDHGKTTLLDYIRKTNVAGREAGGITQGIGASIVETKEGKKITFVDTPGHAAFAKMRAQGAKVADIAILVVAVDDGVKPQTKEALEYILAADIPFIVAATKIDKPSTSVGKVRGDLEKEGVLFEGKGGEVPLVAVSGKTGKGVDELLETITLVAEVNEIKIDPASALSAAVIETSKDRRGPLASVVVTDGELKVGDDVETQTTQTRVRGLFNWKGKSVKAVFPGEPGLILGFKNLPTVGSKVWKKGEETKLQKKSAKSVKVEMGEGEIPVVIKAASAGSLQAIEDNLPKGVFVVHSQVGNVNESDVFLAKPSEATILAFEVKVSSSVRKLAETEGLKIEEFEIIYKLFEFLEQILEGEKENVTGKAKIVASFPYNKKKVAGCKVIEGVIKKENPLKLMRDDNELGIVKITSLKREKQDIGQAKQGEEFGVVFRPQLDFVKGDMLLSVRQK
jgi:translation initiation factor IF-2